MANPLITVVMPVKNGERFVRQAIDSVIAQTYRPIEFFVIGGKSTDKSDEIARSYDEVTLIEQQGDGIPDAWNTGIARAGGDLIAFISSDDKWLDHKLKTQAAYMMDNPERLYSIGKFRFFLEPGYEVPKGFNAALLDCDMVGRIPESLMARPAAFEQVGLFRVDYNTAHDVDWFARAKDMDIPMGVIEDVFLHKRVHDDNVSSNAELNTRLLLQIMRDSIVRQRAQKAQEQPDDSATSTEARNDG